MKASIYLMFLLVSVALWSCTSNATTGGNLKITFKFDVNQERLDSNGVPETANTSVGAQHIYVKRFAISRIEFNKGNDSTTANAMTFYKIKDTVINNVYVVNYPNLVWLDSIQNVLSIPLQNIPAGTYQYMKIEFAMLEYTIQGQINLNQSNFVKVTMPTKTVLSHACYINTITIGDSTELLNGIRPIGFTMSLLHSTNPPIHRVLRSPAVIVTAPNPIYKTCPSIPYSGIITNAFLNKNLVIDGKSNEDINLDVSFSTNNAFEYADNNNNKAYDVVPITETIRNFGLRGMKPVVK